MIIGIGSDIIDARRIAKTIERHGDRFLDRIYTPAERAKAEGRAKPVETFAKRFAAKEPAPRRSAPVSGAACSGATWGVVNLPSGRPTMKLTAARWSGCGRSRAGL